MYENSSTEGNLGVWKGAGYGLHDFPAPVIYNTTFGSILPSSHTKFMWHPIINCKNINNFEMQCKKMYIYSRGSPFWLEIWNKASE